MSDLLEANRSLEIRQVSYHVQVVFRGFVLVLQDHEDAGSDSELCQREMSSCVKCLLEQLHVTRWNLLATVRHPFTPKLRIFNLELRLFANMQWTDTSKIRFGRQFSSEQSDTSSSRV